MDTTYCQVLNRYTLNKYLEITLKSNIIELIGDNMFKEVPDIITKDTRKAVFNRTTGERFISIADAARSINVNRMRIKEAIERNGTAYGFKWEYANDLIQK